MTLFDDIRARRRAFVIAEIAQAHGGDLDAAEAMICECADAGVDAVKFQMHFTDDPVGVPGREDYWKRTGFEFDQWEDLFYCAEENGVTFLCSPFSTRAVEWLERLDVRAYKIASGVALCDEIVDACIATGKPLIISNGLASRERIDAIRERAPQESAVLSCVSVYPTPLSMIKTLGLGFTGISDHSGSPHPAMFAIARGAQIVEVHYKDNDPCSSWKSPGNPDDESSLTTDQIEEITAFALSASQMIEPRVEPSPEHIKAMVAKYGPR